MSINEIELTYNQIPYFVCQRLDVWLEDVLSRSKKHKIVLVRFIICYYLRQKFLTFEEIGKILGRNHATIVYALKQYDNLVATKDPQFMDMLKRL